MATSSLALLSLFFTIFSLAASVSAHEGFLQCLDSCPSVPFHTPDTFSYSSAFQFSLRNYRFTQERKPDFILTPTEESQVQAAVICARKHHFQLKIRSGGHDFEGLSYRSDVPFVILDLINLDSVTVDVEEGTAWGQAGASLGQLYYAIAEKSGTYAFPGGVCPTVGMGGHISGGGYGSLMRKYGLAADNILDAWIINADGKILNRETMGEDLFWAIRGGGASSFCVILSWKVKLVRVPPSITVFRVFRTLEQGATALVERWQHVAPKLPRDMGFAQLLINVVNSTQEGKKTVMATFQTVFQGRAEDHMAIMDERFPELGLKKEDFIEMSWIQSVLWLVSIPIDSPLEVLLDKKTTGFDPFKSKVDYTKEPISKEGLEGVWKFVLEESNPLLLITAYGERMHEIPESSIPFPHREGNLFSFLQVAYWGAHEEAKEAKEHINWIRRLNNYLTPYVSKSPRASYFNYNDLDLGESKNGTTTYSKAKSWGKMYFKDNFERLVEVKTKVDPGNFFRNEQSIPTWGK